MEEILPSKTPAHEFLAVGMNTNSGSSFSRPVKLLLTNTNGEEIAQP